MNKIIKKVFITGASGGIGSAICEKFISNNYILILTSSSEDKLINLKKNYGNNHFYYKVNLLDQIDLENSLKTISSEHTDISVIVNNAGITDDSLIMRMSSDQWINVIETNLSSNYRSIKSLVPIMLSKKYG